MEAKKVDVVYNGYNEVVSSL